MLKQANETHWTRETAAHLLNRSGFGGSPSEIDRLHKRGLKKALAKVLSGKKEPITFRQLAWTEGADGDRRRYFKMRQELKDLPPKEAAEKRRTLQRELRATQRRQSSDMFAWWFERMCRTHHPLEEKMTLFWHGHFATSMQKVKSPALMHRQNELFRKHALGDFKQLTSDVTEDPAMMLYLDTNQNKKGKPNENFARELMELFTLGEGRGYTEADVKEAARAFTGYQLDRRSGKAQLNRRHHDATEKTILGKTGNFKSEDVVDILFAREECAEHIVTKLWEFFAYENPEPEIVKPLAKGFRENGYKVRPVLKAIFSSEAFFSKKAVRTQIKSPAQFVVQMVRQLELDGLPTPVAFGAMTQLGQSLYHPPNVAGWDGGKAWINTNTLLARYNVASFVLKGRDSQFRMNMGMRGAAQAMDKRAKRRMQEWKAPVPYKKIAPNKLREEQDKLVADLIFRLFQDELKPADRKKFEQFAASKKDDAFTDTEVAELLHLMMSTPQYQLT